jgi:hypothetical protein
VGQVDLATELLEQVHGPVPAITGLEDDLGVLPGGHDRLLEGQRVVVVVADHIESLALGTAPDDHAPAAVQVDPDVFFGLHLGPPSSWSGRFRNRQSVLTGSSTARADLDLLGTIRRHAGLL